MSNGGDMNDRINSDDQPSVSNELDKIKAMLTFMADSTDLLLTTTMSEGQIPMSETPYGMHLFFMELISKLDKASRSVD